MNPAQEQKVEHSHAGRTPSWLPGPGTPYSVITAVSSDPKADLESKPHMSSRQALISIIIADHHWAAHKFGLKVNQELDYEHPERPFKLGAATGLTLYVNSRKLQRSQVSLKLC